MGMGAIANAGEVRGAADALAFKASAVGPSSSSAYGGDTTR